MAWAVRGTIQKSPIPLSLISAIPPLISFSIVLFPIFSRMKGRKLENAFKKSVKITFLTSAVAFLFVLLFAPLIIKIIYGSAYLPSINLLRLFSLLLLPHTISSIYISYFVSKGKPMIVTKILIISTLLNIVLNYVLIKSLIVYGDIFAIYGVSAATLILTVLALIAVFIGTRPSKNDITVQQAASLLMEALLSAEHNDYSNAVSLANEVITKFPIYAKEQGVSQLKTVWGQTLSAQNLWIKTKALISALAQKKQVGRWLLSLARAESWK